MAMGKKPAAQQVSPMWVHTGDLPASSRPGDGSHPVGVADKGYHSDKTLMALDGIGVRTYVSEPERGRRCWQDKRTGETPPGDCHMSGRRHAPPSQQPHYTDPGAPHRLFLNWILSQLH